MRKDIQTINEAYESIRKPFDNATLTEQPEDDYNSLLNLFNGALIKAKSTFVQSLKNEMDREISHRRQINAGTKGELDALQSKADTLIRNVAEDIDKMDLGFAKYIKEDEDEEKNVKRHSVERNTAEMRAQFTKDPSAANVRRPLVDRLVQGIKRDTYKPQGGI
jgi:heat shock protein HspQ